MEKLVASDLSSFGTSQRRHSNFSSTPQELNQPCPNYLLLCNELTQNVNLIILRARNSSGAQLGGPSFFFTRHRLRSLGGIQLVQSWVWWSRADTLSGWLDGWA